MIELPNYDKKYDYETFFHLTLDVGRMAKLIAHYEAFKMIREVPGEIVECGVFKGTSLSRFAIYRELLGTYYSAKLIGFDVFSDEYPDTKYKEDKAQRDFWIKTAGSSSISTSQLKDIFEKMSIRNYELIAGDVLETIPEYISNNPHLKISLLNIDIDFVESTMCVLEHFYPRVSKGGIILLDNYGAFHGDTKGVDDFLKDRNIEIKKFPFATRPCYIIK
ncbi:dTDP-6-deoxy-L-hexose 3-O-methyltransferase [Tolypothrix sp. PCC 7910]|uniref:TylF/MycF/NovP-related O-methyltransferase n=1 Tax=Tolypothrix sp. PCC 7910 TaxID=2099387 RepID=UPI0014277525|nr:TylF/MycF/NovP-related O-methyltransferase [Tolypothrix sp. PCC 7910]QIR39093.1 dTDP-6-deoxy-L-hexose 3-O-methyltransferase [Tolypothrix sp. PCC 7910]